MDVHSRSGSAPNPPRHRIRPAQGSCAGAKISGPVSARSTSCGSRSIAAAAALLALLAFAAPAGAATPAWSAEQQLTSTPAFDPAVAVDPAGNAVVAWSDPGWGAVHASFRPAGRSSFGPPQRLSELGGRFPSVAFDGDGNAVVAWARLLRGDPEHWLVEAARISSSGSFSEPQAVSPQLAYLGGQDIQLAVARNGRALIAYNGGVERDGGDLKVWGALANAGGPFSRPSALSAPGNSAIEAGLGDDGEGVVTWERWVPRGWPISISSDYYYEGVPVTDDGFGATQPTSGSNGGLAVSSQGEAIYTSFDPEGFWAASAPPGGWFGERQLVKPRDREYPYGLYDPVGNFPQDDGSMLLLFWENYRLYEAIRPAGGLYDATVELTGAPDPPTREKTTADREGNVAWFWAQEEDHREDSENGGLKLVRRQVGQPFGEVESLSEPNVNPGYQVALGDGGRAVAVWSHSGGAPEGTWVSSVPSGPAGDEYQYGPGDPIGAAAEPAKRPVTKRRVGLRVSCYIACDVHLTGGVRTGSYTRFAKLEPAALRMRSGGTRGVRLGLSRTAAKWVREAAARDRRVRVRVKLRVSDEFGTGRTLKRRFWARP